MQANGKKIIQQLEEGRYPVRRGVKQGKDIARKRNETTKELRHEP